jgi:hypothetical protein
VPAPEVIAAPAAEVVAAPAVPGPVAAAPAPAFAAPPSEVVVASDTAAEVFAAPAVPGPVVAAPEIVPAPAAPAAEVLAAPAPPAPVSGPGPVAAPPAPAGPVARAPEGKRVAGAALFNATLEWALNNTQSELHPLIIGASSLGIELGVPLGVLAAVLIFLVVAYQVSLKKYGREGVRLKVKQFCGGFKNVSRWLQVCWPRKVSPAARSRLHFGSSSYEEGLDNLRERLVQCLNSIKNWFLPKKDQSDFLNGVFDGIDAGDQELYMNSINNRFKWPEEYPSPDHIYEVLDSPLVQSAQEKRTQRQLREHIEREREKHGAKKNVTANLMNFTNSFSESFDSDFSAAVEQPRERVQGVAASQPAAVIVIEAEVHASADGAAPGGHAAAAGASGQVEDPVPSDGVAILVVEDSVTSSASHSSSFSIDFSNLTSRSSPTRSNVTSSASPAASFVTPGSHVTAVYSAVTSPTSPAQSNVTAGSIVTSPASAAGSLVTSIIAGGAAALQTLRRSTRTQIPVDRLVYNSLGNPSNSVSGKERKPSADDLFVGQKP